MLGFKNISLRIRIFLAMLLLVLLASVLIITVTIYQYDEQTKDYNATRLGRKEASTKRTIDIELQQKTSYPVTTQNLPLIFQDRIYEISFIHSMHITLYDMSGDFLKTSITDNAFQQTTHPTLSKEILLELANSSEHRLVRSRSEEGRVGKEGCGRGG